MPNPIWLGSGGCPTIAPVAMVTPLLCTLQGYYPFILGADAYTLYRQFTITQDASLVMTITPSSPGTGGSFPQMETETISPLSTSPKDNTTPDTHIAITNAALSPGANSAFDTTLGGSFPSLSGQSADGISENDALDPGARLHGFKWKAHFASATLFQLKTIHQVVTGAAGGSTATYEINAVTHSVELVNPDTEEDAVARAATGGTPMEADGTGTDDFGFAAGLYSLHETRPGAPWITFGHQSGTCQLRCANLTPGVLYRYVVVWEQRTAMGNGLGDSSAYGTTWANSEVSTDTFRPTGTSHVTDAIAIPIAAGYQKRIKSINLTPLDG